MEALLPVLAASCGEGTKGVFRFGLWKLRWLD